MRTLFSFQNIKNRIADNILFIFTDDYLLFKCLFIVRQFDPFEFKKFNNH